MPAKRSCRSYDARLSRIVDHEQIVHRVGETSAAGESAHSIDHPVTDYDKRFHDVNDDWLDSIIHARPCCLAPEDMLYSAAVSAGFGDEALGRLRLGRDGLE